MGAVSQPTMRRLAAALAIVCLGSPAMAGGLSSGVKNTYFKNNSTENITRGYRDITVNTTAYNAYEGYTESCKEFIDTTLSMDGVSGTFEFSTATGLALPEGSGEEGTQEQTSGPFGRENGHWHYYSADGSGDPMPVSQSVETAVLTFENPKVQYTVSSGYTKSFVNGWGESTTDTHVSIQEHYTGTSTQMEHGHEATSFAGSF